MQDFKELEVWQKGVALTEAVYEAVQCFLKWEFWGLARQMCKAASSIPSNIAEGQGRGTRNDYRHFVLNAVARRPNLRPNSSLPRRWVTLMTEPSKAWWNRLTRSDA